MKMMMMKMTISGKHTHTAENAHQNRKDKENGYKKKKKKICQSILDEIRKVKKNEIKIKCEISWNFYLNVLPKIRSDAKNRKKIERK